MPPGRGSRIASPAPQPLLPKASFRKVDDEKVNEPQGVNDPIARSYGYNDFSFFTRPQHYIRFIEPLENELNSHVEYDMDEQDYEWLELVNEERKKAQVGAVSAEIFEILMDKLEKEWFEIMKRVPKADMGLPSEDSTCAVCDDGEGENSNAIVFCDGCNLAVHQDCYGVPYIPEGQWLCRKCTVSPEVPVACVFCSNEGGAFKQTSTGLWAHLLCAMFIPEVTVGNTLFMEPIEAVDKVPKSRWRLTCSLCRIRGGACIQCDKSSCFAAFHVTCARRAKLLMGMKGLSGEETAFKGYCEKHLPEDVKKSRGEITDSFEGPLTIQSRTPKSSKTARAYAKKYNIGPPLVPQLIVDKLEDYYKKHFRQKAQFIQLVCKYWSLKREARRGAPLLKRLHLEPWSTSSINKPHTEQEKAMKLDYLLGLRNNLQKVRALTGLMRQREELKLQQAQLFRDIISDMIFPHSARLKRILGQVQSMDKNDIFRFPVTRAEAPDYYDIIKNPMCFSMIEAKIEDGSYLDFESFKAAINLIFDNAMLYNKRDTVFHKSASRLKAASASILTPFSEQVTLAEDAAGNLEASSEVLHMLLSEEKITGDTDFTIGTDPITSLFRFELPKVKPMPLVSPPQASPSPPPSPKQKTEKPKRDYRAEKERKKQIQAQVAEAAGFWDFRAPRMTRSGKVIPTMAEAPELDFTTNGIAQMVEHKIEDTSVVVSITNKETLPEVVCSKSPTTVAPFGSEKPKSRTWKRDPLVLPGQGAPNMMESVDKQDSFKNFHRGWILTSGTRRHGRAVPELPSPQESPPRKQSRMERDRSRISVITSGSDAPPQSLPPTMETQLDAGNDAMDVDQISIDRKSTGAEETKPDITTRVLKRKRSQSVQKMSLTPTEQEPCEKVQSPAKLNLKKVGWKGSSASRPKGHGPTRGIISMKEGESLQGGTLVWAKMESYPWWAAVVWEEDTKGVPQNVLKNKENVQRTEAGPLILVQFYDKSRSWQWLELSSLRMLGEHNELDQELLSGHSKVQVFRTTRMKTLCRAAYKEACAEMEQPGEDHGESTRTPMESSASVDAGNNDEADDDKSQSGEYLSSSLRGAVHADGEGVPDEHAEGKTPSSESSELSDIDFEK